MDQPDHPAPRRGRPKTRFADRKEQVRQNMRVYRARLAAEQLALGRSLEKLLQEVGSGDVERTFAAAAAVAGLWQESLARARREGKAGKQEIGPEDLQAAGRPARED